MKKTYIEPKTTVVALKVRSNMLDSSPNSQQVFNMDKSAKTNVVDEETFVEMNSRESINAWEEW